MNVILSEAKDLESQVQTLPGTDEPGRCQSHRTLPQSDIFQ